MMRDEKTAKRDVLFAVYFYKPSIVAVKGSVQPRSFQNLNNLAVIFTSL